ncbi:hypothetical protein L0128_19700 [candidate division KSB1 bacterium]|nr:hypothetical protein [candidate division KSB1 bacterium]
MMPFDQRFLLKSGCLLFLLSVCLLACDSTPRTVMQGYQFQEQSGLPIEVLPLYFNTELPPKAAKKNRFVLLQAGKIIPCFTTVLSHHPDGSIYQLRVWWIAEKIQPFEKRTYDLAYTSRSSVRLRNPQIEKRAAGLKITNKILPVTLSQNGLREINFGRNYAIQSDSFQVITEDEMDGYPSLQNRQQHLIPIESNPIYTHVKIIEIDINYFKIVKNYLIFNDIALIVRVDSLVILDSLKLALISPISWEFSTPGFDSVRFCGTLPKTLPLTPNMDWYDYYISQSPHSYLRLGYQNQLLKTMNYHFIGTRRQRTRPLNACTVWQRGEPTAITLFTPETNWKRHTAFHVAQNEAGQLHLSWHGHGFQTKRHWFRFYRGREQLPCVPGQALVFVSYIYWHASNIPEDEWSRFMTMIINLSYEKTIK